MNREYNMAKYSKNDFSKKQLMRMVSALQYENRKLEDALDNVCDMLSKTNLKTTCGDYVKTCMENHCYGVNCVHSRSFTKSEWREEFMKDE